MICLLSIEYDANASFVNIFCLQVITEGRLLLEFTFDDLMRIRSWHFMTRQHHELVPRNVVVVQVRHYYYVTGQQVSK